MVRGRRYCLETILAVAASASFRMQTLLVKGDGFIAVDITIENSGESGNVSTVAVENWSDRSIFYRCTLKSHHQVLRTHGSRQFYRDSDIQGGSGSSLISGQAQAFFQDCRITIDGGVSKVQNVVAEQLRGGPNAEGGFIFHLCQISQYKNLSSRVFLGAASTPYYSRIAYLECRIDLQAAAWLNNGFKRGTVFFGEYKNTRFGSAYNSSSSSSDDVKVLDFAAASQLSLRHFFSKGLIPVDIPQKPDLGR